MTDAPNWIPESYTGISDAFALFFERKFPNCGLLAFASEKKLEIETKGRLRSDILDKLSSGYEDALDNAAEIFRNALSSDELRGFIRDPLSGKLGYIHRSSWLIDPKTGDAADFLRCNYVGPGNERSDFGPDTRLKGERQPVLVSTEALQDWLSREFSVIDPSCAVRTGQSDPSTCHGNVSESLTPSIGGGKTRILSDRAAEMIQTAFQSICDSGKDIRYYPVPKRNEILNKEIYSRYQRRYSDRMFQEFFSRLDVSSPGKE